MVSITEIAAASIAGGDTSGIAVPLSDRFNDALAHDFVHAGSERQAILAAANDPRTASSPELLFQLQLRQEAYTKQMALSSALLSHATKGVETLVKS